MKTKLIIAIVMAVLLAGNIVLGILFYLDSVKLKQAQQKLTAQQTNAKVLAFSQLFVDKVLLGEGTVSFEDRLKLENAVRDIADPEIFDCWQRFTNSKTDKDAQQEVGRMFSLIIGKIYQK